MIFSVMIRFSEPIRFSPRSNSLPEVLRLKHFAFDFVSFFGFTYIYLF